jgi:hypothetical protein
MNEKHKDLIKIEDFIGVKLYFLKIFYPNIMKLSARNKLKGKIIFVRDDGADPYNRVTTLIQYIAAVGSNLNSATQNFNKVVGLLENRFIHR